MSVTNAYGAKAFMYYRGYFWAQTWHARAKMIWVYKIWSKIYAKSAFSNAMMMLGPEWIGRDLLVNVNCKREKEEERPRNKFTCGNDALDGTFWELAYWTELIHFFLFFGSSVLRWSRRSFGYVVWSFFFMNVYIYIAPTGYVTRKKVIIRFVHWSAVTNATPHM